MQTKGWTLLRSLLNKFGHNVTPESFKDIFLSDVSDEEANQILKFDSSSNQPELILKLSERMIDSTHYSWMASTIEAMPPFFQSRFLGLLPEKKRDRLSEKLGIQPKEAEYLPQFRMMILNTFYQAFNARDILPQEFLPTSPMNALLEHKKEDLVTLIDLLGVHDLAEEMRGIVDQKMIKAIYRCLKPHQHRHLYLCLHQQEKVTSPPLDLFGWNGNCKTLQKKLHVRGIIRLAKALSGQHRDLIWYVTHALDTGRGEVLKQHLQDEPIAKVTPALQQQVKQTLNYLNGKSKS